MVQCELLGVLDRDLLDLRVLGMAVLGDVRIQLLGDSLFRQLRNPPPQSDMAVVDLGNAHAHRLADTTGELTAFVDRGREVGHRLAHHRAQSPDPHDLGPFAVGKIDACHRVRLTQAHERGGKTARLTTPAMLTSTTPARLARVRRRATTAPARPASGSATASPTNSGASYVPPTTARPPATAASSPNATQSARSPVSP